MQTLRKLFNEISLDNERWSYYKNTNILINDCWESSDSDKALCFIENYFNFANKSNAFNDIHLRKNRDILKMRSNHIISTFLLGIKIAESFNIDCDTRSEDGFNFKYYWFLSCLYHDIGYAYEKKNSSEQLKKIRNDGIAALKQICNIEYLDDSIFKSISKEHVNIYFKYRAANNREHGGTIDHGIIGGLILYDRLRKQFEISWKKRINKNDDRTSFYVIGADNRKLHLSNSHFVAYAKVADSIIRHSIFNETLNCYIKEEKTNIPLFNEKISIDNKLGFVLGIADTLEPLKRNHKYLDSVSLETIKEPPGIRICIKEEDYNKLYSKIEELKDWISVNIKSFKEESNIIVEITGNTN